MTSDKEQVILSALLIYEEWCADRAFEEEIDSPWKKFYTDQEKFTRDILEEMLKEDM